MVFVTNISPVRLNRKQPSDACRIQNQYQIKTSVTLDNFDVPLYLCGLV